MTISFYTASVPVFKQALHSLKAILAKAEQHATAKHLEADALLKARLFPDMFHLIRQVQIAADFAKGVPARLAGIEVPPYDDNENSFSDLQARLDRTLAFIDGLKPEQFNGAGEREIVLRPGTPKEKRFTGEDYLLHYGLQHFFFHVTTAYDILRHNGVEIGKGDYIGQH
ncbi:hypothetical protein FHW67_003653 [Herbaspirillum sp. Sphag1AN]|uniref:DUF1993 domain-containing protein n=1 Tax=unclassified Herbaspirillum TaxID=2624150 RepID=UPI00160C4E5C|nr:MULTISPECIES: DUF1993 domain-containing protein [unclassified Herbaspirillum]MBB3214338.1 hypothetical protein [Herbaspirillum sp. Sphag1AN]MBB3247390.1 hypothetical protein [Herbaspirillum sp. Sphag64]